MKKNKTQIKQANNPAEKVYVSEIDYDKLAKAIVKAHNDIEKQKQDEIGKETEEWRKTIGFDVKKTGVSALINKMDCFRKVIFMKRKDATTSKTAYSLIQLSTESAFNVIKTILYVLTGLFWFFGIYSIISKNLFVDGAFYLILGVVIWVFARVFRIAAFEVSNMKNREQIVAICSSITAIVALLISVISFMVGVIK